MRFSVQKKIVLLGAGLSLLLTITAFLTSFYVYNNKSQENYINSIDNSIEELKNSIGDKSSLDDMTPIVAKTLLIYLDHINDPVPEFQDLDEKYNYYAKQYTIIYPAINDMFDLSQIKLRYQNTYLDISSSLTNASISAGTNIAYAGVVLDPFVTGDNGRILYVFDSKFRFGNRDGNFFGTDYMLTPEDKDVNPNQSTGEFIIRGSNARTIDFDLGTFREIVEYAYDNDTNTVDSIMADYPEEVRNMSVVVTAFIEYDLAILNADYGFFAMIEGISLLAVLIILAISYILIARFVIVKNIVELTSSTKEFTNKIKSGEEISVINPNVKSRDEIGNLSESFVLLENEIINYVARIEYESKERERISTELSVASKIQIEALPKSSYIDKNITLDSSITSAKEVGGDFYDYFYIDNDNFAIVISDVSGKGVPAALFMMRGKELIKSKLISKMKLEDVCFSVNNDLLENNEEGLFITSFIGIYNIKNDELTFVNCGHEKPFLVGSDIKKMETNSNFVLGGVKDFTYKSEKIILNSNRLFLYTDGLNESINSQREEFSYNRINDTLAKNKDYANKKILSNVITELNTFTEGMEQFDDITMVIFNSNKNEISLEYKNPGFEIIDGITAEVNKSFSYIDKKVLSEIAIIVDEMINNYISYEKVDNLVINVNMKVDGDYIHIIFKNNGKEFDPFTIPDEYIEDENNIGRIGGFGFTIVKKLVDDIAYKRENELNILSMKKKI